MKKVLSLMLTIALILTTMAVPMVVSAAEGDVTLTAVAYKNGTEVNAENPAYMGDTVTLKIYAQAETVDVTFSALTAMFNLSSGLSYTELPTGVTANTTNKLRLANVDVEGDTITTSAPVTLAELVLTVNANTDQTVTFESNYTSIVSSNYTEVPLVLEDGTVDVEVASAVAQVKTSVAGDYTTLADNKVEVFTDATSVSAKVVATGNIEYANLYKEGNEEVVANLAEGEATILAANAGTYTIKVKMKGGDEAVYTFIYTAVEIDARVSIDTPEAAANGYVRGAEFDLPITISGIGTFTAAMAQFTVTYDPSVLTLDTTDANIEYAANEGATESSVTYTVTVGKNNDANVANNGEVTSLGFTVADAAALGNTTVAINGVKWTQASNTTIIVEDEELGVATASAALVIIPTSDFATVTPGASEATATAYDVTVAAETGVTVKVLTLPIGEKFADETSEATILDEIKANGTEVTGGKFTVEENKVYYIAASVGTSPIVYDYIGEHVSLLDVTGPEIDEDVLATLNQDAWTPTAGKDDVAAIELPAALVTADDFAKFQWSTSANENFADATDNKIAIAADFSAETIYIKAVDTLGNAGAAKSFTVKYDGTAPTFNAEVGLFNDEGTGKAINITAVADTYSGVGTVKVYLDETEKATLTAPDYAYTATDSGTYYVVVTDIAGNETKSEALEVDLGKVNLPSVTVTTVNGGAGVADRFKNDAEIASYTTADNGTFSYIKIAVGIVDEANVTYTLAKDGGNAEPKTGAIELVGSAETAGKYVLTVTSTATADSNNNNTASYTFSIAGSAEEMMSVDNKPYYNALDYALVNKITTGAGSEAVVLPTVADNFTGGIFSADVNGDLKYTAEDVTEILSALQRVLIVGEYDFDIMNQFAPVAGE